MKEQNNSKCKIVQDLIPSYMENLLSDESKSFVNEHISTCDECKEYLDTISQNISNEDKQIGETNNLDIDYLKKYRKKINILKITIFTILILIMAIIITVFARYNYNRHILDSALKQFEKIKLSDNFYISRKTIDIEYQNNTTNQYFYEIYYKDGKYKRSSDSYIVYGDINSTKYLEIFHDTKSIENIELNYIPYTKDKLFMLYKDIYNYSIDSKSMKTRLYALNLISIRKDKYNNRDCYVVKNAISENGYHEYWIDKESNMVVRTISKSDGVYYREEIFTIILNQTQDEDVEIIDNFEQYSNYTFKDAIVTDDIMKEWSEKYS